MKVLILAVSAKYHGFCVAGLSMDDLSFVRLGKIVPDSLECGPLSVSDVTCNGRLISINDIIDVDAKKMPVNGCQTENYELIEIKKYYKKITFEEFMKIYESIQKPQFIFTDNKDHIMLENVPKYSLCLCKVDNLKTYENYNMNNRPKLKASFVYNGYTYYKMSVTDCNMIGLPGDFGTRGFINAKAAFILVSLPYDSWSESNGFYKYVSGIIYDTNQFDKE